MHPGCSGPSLHRAEGPHTITGWIGLGLRQKVRAADGLMAMAQREPEWSATPPFWGQRVTL